jgi:hypothetical protein
VWKEHQAVFRAAGRTFHRYWKVTWQEFNMLYRIASA